MGGLYYYISIYSGHGIVELKTKTMAPILGQNDKVLLQKKAYIGPKAFPPKRGDIVIFPTGTQPEFNIARILGLPKDYVVIHQHQVYINGKPIESKSTNLTTLYRTARGLKDFVTCYTEGHQNGYYDVCYNLYRERGFQYPRFDLKEDEYLVVGDNRYMPKENVDFAVIKKEEIVGRVDMLLWNGFEPYFKDVAPASLAE